MKMKRLSGKEMRQFLSHDGTKDSGKHRFDKHVMSWLYCSRCGLVNLNNKPTRKAMRSACVIYV